MLKYLLGVAVALAVPVATAATPLDDYRGEALPLLVFAPSERDERYEEQHAALSRHFGSLTERNMAVISVIGSEPVSVMTGQRPDEAINEELRQVFDVDGDGFAVVLVDKDGEVRGRWAEPVDPSDIISLVDTIPFDRVEPLRAQ